MKISTAGLRFGCIGAAAIAVSLIASVGPAEAVVIPAPQPATTQYLVGANYFPGWSVSESGPVWGRIAQDAARTPALGYYEGASPEAADWEIKWAVENGINFFNYCWYRTGDNVGHPMTGTQDQKCGTSLNNGMLNATLRNQFHFAITYENNSGAGVSSSNDLVHNLGDYWLNNYFTNPSYLKIDNKPVLYIYGAGDIVDSLGGAAATNAALNQMRTNAQARGLAGLYIIGMCSLNSGQLPGYTQTIADAGFDAQTDYKNTVSGSPTNQTQIINSQVARLNTFKSDGILPYVPVASMGYNDKPWASDLTPPQSQGSRPHWQLTPTSYQSLLSQEKGIMDATAAQSGSVSKMILLDNWNEWGEGHYIAPTNQQAGGAGFGYLQSVRNVFTAKDNTPDYLTPQQQGFGPYDTAYSNYFTPVNGVLYKDAFARTGNLHHTTVTNDAIGSGFWIADPNPSTADPTKAVWTTNGAKAVSQGGGNAFMPFTPAAGKVYKLSADIQLTGTSSGSFGLGFTNNDDLFDTSNFLGTGAAWWYESTGNTSCASVLGPNTANYQWHGFDSSRSNNFSVLLDTRGTYWTISWYLNDQLQRTATYATNLTISFVGMGGSASAWVDNFSLVPEPGPFAILGTGLIAALAYLWRKRK
jgi:hypothetical protein